MPSIFAGIWVVELSQVFAGPLAARLLAEQGATVVKVERPGGEISRQLPWRDGGHSGYFVQMNRGKLGVTLDLKQAEDRDTLWRLLGQADVAIDGFGPGVLARFGFTSEAILQHNERLVLCEMSALGREGELGSMRGYDQVGACYSGVAYTTGGRNGELPVMPPVALGDAMMGLSAYAGIVSALYERLRSGKGQRVDVSLVDAYIQSHSSNIEIYGLSGGDVDPRPIDGQNPTTCPAGVFRTPDDRHIYIVALSNEEWLRLCRCMERADLADDGSLRQNEGRVAHRQVVVGAIESWLESCGDRETALRLLTESGVVAAPVLSIGEVVAHDHLRERGTVEWLTHPVLGEFPVPGPPFRLSRSPRVELGAAPELGEHNAAVLERLADADEADLDERAVAGAP